MDNEDSLGFGGDSATDMNASAPDTMDIENDAPADERAETEEEEEEYEDLMEDDLTILTRALTNERAAPDILEYEGTAIENLMELADFQLQRIPSQPALVANILKMDVDRVKYLVRSYLRTRLYKIEQYARHYTNDPVYRGRLSQNELDYASGFVELGDKHVRRSFLDQLPPHLRDVNESGIKGLDMVGKPDLDSAVFCKVRANVGEFQFEASEDPIFMKRNNIFITRYSIIRNLLENGKVELI
ncbi:GINS complex subunit [Coemansia sp. RSA 1813]|nr:GINS complex subunit [Coemansia sp. RSA 1646]KAJ1770607.1 GINS complex subunit [Coemansia sp. RSA 1843]KAJ2091395.1 GINS complex subunit [Coemansia sp. RSA 986]KAJ2212848.1 GINS complex subunit [Coemansia sp. RSA 487]KAJ2569557.1 GINS complex subunit [Coemansia sp. RSA 1813]